MEGVSAEGANDAAATGEKKKKKKRKPKKKKTGTSGAKVQSDPPRVPVAQLFPNSTYPVGEEVEYLNDQQYRTTSEEKRHLDRTRADFLAEYRQGAEIHRQTRAWAQKNIKPGMTLHEIANGIEDCTRALTGHQGLEEGDGLIAGVGFPTGLSINHCAAHYKPNSTSKPWVVGEKDVLKVDFGVHINQRIVDSAFTMTWDPTYDNLLAAVKDATNTETAGDRSSVNKGALDTAAGQQQDALLHKDREYKRRRNENGKKDLKKPRAAVPSFPTIAPKASGALVNSAGKVTSFD